MSSSYSSLDWVLSHWAHFTVLFLFICVFFCFILHSCCIIVRAVGWTGWDWSLILPSVLWHSCLGHLTCKKSNAVSCERHCVFRTSACIYPLVHLWSSLLTRYLTNRLWEFVTMIQLGTKMNCVDLEVKGQRWKVMVTTRPYTCMIKACWKVFSHLCPECIYLC